jgi:malate synthase
MTHNMVSVPTISIAGTQGAAEAEILTPEALDFLASLSTTFEEERQRLLAARLSLRFSA